MTGAPFCYSDGQLFQAPTRDDLEIFDRVGGGDSFASGLDLWVPRGQRPAVGRGVRRSTRALAMTTPGDTTMVTLSEVEKVMKGGGARVER
jgi:2-dehydro-3-deoxygluconokinase